MTKDQKNEVIEALKEKFSQYNNFYVTDTESLSVAQIVKLRRARPIVAYREEHGQFSKPEDLKKIMIVTDDVFLKMAPYLQVQ